jgi:hypothetical protein
LDPNPDKSRPKKNPALSDLFCLIKPARDFNPRPGFFLPTQSLDQIHTSVALEKNPSSKADLLDEMWRRDSPDGDASFSPLSAAINSASNLLFVRNY